jgi:hypothetical protein
VEEETAQQPAPQMEGYHFAMHDTQIRQVAALSIAVRSELRCIGVQVNPSIKHPVS